MPCNYKRDYPADWKEISKRIRFERAGGKCEWCKKPNGWTIHCTRSGDWFDPQADCWMTVKGERWPDGVDPTEDDRPVKIVLTVAHLGTPHADGVPGDKHNKHDVRDENLAALCQSCHLRFDHADHIQHGKETRFNRRAAGLLLEVETK